MTSADGPTRVGPPPLAAERRAEVLAVVSRQGAARVTELARELGVTPVTVRRDVAELARAGLLRRVHGGVTVLDRESLPVRVDEPAPGTASALMPEQPAESGRLGVLVPSLDYYWPSVVRGAEQYAGGRGRRVVLRRSSYESPDERGDVRRLVEAGCEGLLLAPNLVPGPGDLMREWLAAAPVPVVLMERSFETGAEHRPAESVITDHAGGAAMGVHHLASLGHTRIGVALSDGSPHWDEIRRGWHRAMGALGLSAEESVEARVPNYRAAPFIAEVDSVLDSVLRSRTTGLLLHSDREAIGFAQRAEERGVRIPGDLSLVSYDDELAPLATPALTAVRPPRGDVGRTATALLLRRLAEPDAPTHRVLVTPTLHVRASTAPPPR